MDKVYLPLDFNSLAKIEGKKLKLSNYYIKYAFSENLTPVEGMRVVFYDKYWTEDPNEIICIDGILEKNEKESWEATLQGQVYKKIEVPKRKYFISFIGADTYALENGGQDTSRDFMDKLANINCFAFAPGSQLPDFSKIVGQKVEELSEFFKFPDLDRKPLTYQPDGRLTDDTWIVRGGGNRTEIN